VNFQAIHPGEILRKEYLAPLKMSAGALAKELNVPRTRIERLVDEATSLTVDTALRLGRYFNTSPQFWLNMKVSYDLAKTAQIRKEIQRIKQREPEAA
jgi:antitoxin HigA-1